MRIGAVFPQTEIGTDPADIRYWAQEAEALGCHHILAYDHVLGAAADTRPGWRGPGSHRPYRTRQLTAAASPAG
jgi:hypothetical protein